MYYLYSIIHAGWLTANFLYTSDIEEAARFPKEKVINIAGNRLDHSGNVTLIPVPSDLIEEIKRD